MTFVTDFFFVFLCVVFCAYSNRYKILDPPADYVPIRTPARPKLMATPTPMGQSGFFMQEEDRGQVFARALSGVFFF